MGTALIILDGWGLAPDGPGNCVRLARTPVTDSLDETCSRTTLVTSGRAVGLPEGQMGNSEVGHLTLGSGRVIPQDLVKISDAIGDGSFFENPVLVEALAGARRVHILGLASDGGVHSDLSHMLALGIHGQIIYMNKQSEVVIVKLSTQPEQVDMEMFMDAFAAMDAVSATLAGDTP